MKKSKKRRYSGFQLAFTMREAFIIWLLIVDLDIFSSLDTSS
jgi:hypothetical protein